MNKTKKKEKKKRKKLAGDDSDIGKKFSSAGLGL
jgi:hypothetical protein